MLYGIKRKLIESSRCSNWNKAKKIYKKTHKLCEACPCEENPDCHDVYPYHLIPNPEKWTVEQWISNFLLLCKHCHMELGHCGDGSGHAYNPKIRELAASMRYYAMHCILKGERQKKPSILSFLRSAVAILNR